MKCYSFEFIIEYGTSHVRYAMCGHACSPTATTSSLPAAQLFAQAVCRNATWTWLCVFSDYVANLFKTILQCRTKDSEAAVASSWNLILVKQSRNKRNCESKSGVCICLHSTKMQYARFHNTTKSKISPLFCVFVSCNEHTRFSISAELCVLCANTDCNGKIIVLEKI